MAKSTKKDQTPADAAPMVPGSTPNAADLKDNAVRLLRDMEDLIARSENLLNVHQDYEELKGKLRDAANWLADKAGLEPTDNGGYAAKQ